MWTWTNYTLGFLGRSRPKVRTHVETGTEPSSLLQVMCKSSNHTGLPEDEGLVITKQSLDPDGIHPARDRVATVRS